MTARALLEGIYSIGIDKKMIPAEMDESGNYIKPPRTILLGICPFLLQMQDGQKYLLDTGSGLGQKSLKEEVPQVDLICLSHLHADHVGGLCTKSEDSYVANFPGTPCYVFEQEWKDKWTKLKSKDEELFFECVQQNYNLFFLKENKGRINEHIQYECSGAHSPFHLVFTLTENDDTFFYGGDEAPQHLQMLHAYVAKYDADGRKAAQLRQQWWEQGTRQGWTFLFYHDLKQNIFSIPKP